MTEENKKPEPLDSARDDSQKVKSAESETLKEAAPAPEAEKPAEEPVKEEAPNEAAPAPEAEKPAAAPQEEGTKKRKKINLMSLKEIDEKLKQVKEKMGNLKSNYASQLLKQQSILGGTKES